MHDALACALLPQGSPSKRSRGALFLLALAIAALGPAAGAVAATAAKPSVPAGFKIAKLAAAPKGTMNCDDLASLEGHFFMGCQNKATSGGGGGNSTLIEYSDTGTVVKTWSLKDKIDGLGADPLNQTLLSFPWVW
ncbi:MAG: hypothetical protein ACR2IP_13405 [Solirubrobacteraceae bacterium]